MPTENERHEQNITRLVRLEMSLDSIKSDVAEMKADIRPLKEALQQAHGFRAGLMVAGLFLMAMLGAGAREIFSWLVTLFGKH